MERCFFGRGGRRPCQRRARGVNVRRLRRSLCDLIAVACVIAVAAVCWHSVEEIHYLKTFYPTRFTVEEAFWASGVELVKVVLIAFPLLLVAGLALVLGWRRPRDGAGS